MRIKFFGVGSAEPSPLEHNLSLLLESENTPLLVDCGGSPAHSILAASLNLNDFTDIFLTHSHTDHIYGLPSLVHSKWMSEGRRSGKKLRLFGSSETLSFARQLLRVFRFDSKRHAVEIEYVAVRDGDEIRASISKHGVMLRSVPVQHGDARTNGIAIECGHDTKVFFSSDTVIFNGLDRYVNQECAVWIMDAGGGWESNAGHAGLNDVFEYADRREFRGTLYLVHLPPTRERFLQEVLAKSLDKRYKVVLPADGDEIEI